MDFKMYLENQEALRDFMRYFPVSELSNWQPRWNISLDKSYVYVKANVDVDSEDSLLMVFKGDGVVSFSGVHDGEKFDDFYDDHCLDKGEKFKRLLKKYAPFLIFLH